ncbi:MAG: hypothetical protein ACKO34_02830, partial [Vampirovibrionales bacterium]
RNRFNCKEDRVAYIEDFVYAYNRTRLKCIGYKAPLEHLCNHAKQYTLGRGSLPIFKNEISQAKTKNSATLSTVFVNFI